MKKNLLLILLALALTVTLAACGGAAASDNTQESTPANETVESAEPTEATEPTESTEPTASNALVAYFSYSGNTAVIAEQIAEETGAELFEIATVEAYPEDYNAVLDVARAEQQDNARPELTAQVDNMESYDVIYLGWPCWWGDCPMAVLTFLEQYDFSGKTIVPFTTHGGSHWGNSLDSVDRACPDATIAEGLAIQDDALSGAADEVSSWLSGLAL